MTGGRGLGERSRLAAARESLLADVEPVTGTETVPVSRADGRILTAPVTPARPVPHYERAAVDGYAVVAESTFGASARSPNALRVAGDEDAPAVDRGTAVRVHTGSQLPDGADAVTTVADAERFGDELELHASVTAGENVSAVGEDVPVDGAIYEDGHRLRPSDLGLLRSAGVASVDVYVHPTVEAVPTGDELVAGDPGPGEVVETNALTVSRCVERWSGRARSRDVVPDDERALRAAVERGLTADLIVTIGGTSAGERDLVADVVADRGTVRHHGLAIEPGHTAAVGVVEDTPILMLPGSPISCIVTACTLLRPALERAGHLSTPPLPTTTATLARKVASEPGVRQFVRVSLRDAPDADRPEAVPVGAGGASARSSVTDADGWVTVPESVEGLPADEDVVVADWEFSS